MSGRNRPQVALLFSQFSAYHIDRCEAVARRLEGRFDVLAIEVATQSQTYAWDASGEVSGAHKLTLFPGQSYEAIGWPRRLWRQFMALRRCEAAFIGIGYNEVDIVLLSWLLRLIGVRVILMSESKFDDFERRAGFEIFKTLVLAAYSGAIVGGQRQASYMRFLGFRQRPVLPGYDTVGLGRIRAMAGGIAAPGGARFKDRPFIFVGRFVAKKNLHLLLEAYTAYRRAAGKNPHRLVLVGSGPEEASLRARAASLGVEDKVDFPGFLSAEQVAQALSRSLALILPSREEQWGLVVNEALAVGLPAIVSHEVGSRDALVRNLVNGFVVDSGSPESLAHAMRELAGDEALWRRMVAASHERAELGDVERLADAAEVLLDPTAGEAAARIELFRKALPPMPLPSGRWGRSSAASQAAPDPAYWQAYYAGAGPPAGPSDFARFALERMDLYPTIIELGCGNGRDSLFFLEQGKRVLAIDASTAAIDACNKQARKRGFDADRAVFAVGEVAARDTWEALAAKLEGPVAIYARFLFHAIDEASEGGLLDHACALIERHGGILLAEFRTPEDAPLLKQAPPHYRRYVDPSHFADRLSRRGLAVIYRRVGRGMARHGSEDAHVAWIVAGPAVRHEAEGPRPALRRLQDAERALAARFVDWCTARNLTAFLVCGSALGAVRHGDIIPWDDDIDIGMLREDYEAFHKAWFEAPLDGVSLQSHETEWLYPLAYAKLRLDGTRVHEPAFADTEFSDGIFIDIFPFDRLPRSRVVRSLQGLALEGVSLLVMSYNRQVAGNSKVGGLRWARRAALVIRPVLPLRRLIRLREWLNNPRGIPRGTTRASFEMWGIRFAKRTWIAEDMLVPTKPCRFGDRDLPVPGKVEEYLTACFGDYQNPPPPNRRQPLHVVSVEFGP